MLTRLGTGVIRGCQFRGRVRALAGWLALWSPLVPSGAVAAAPGSKNGGSAAGVLPQGSLEGSGAERPEAPVAAAPVSLTTGPRQCLQDLLTPPGSIAAFPVAAAQPSDQADAGGEILLLSPVGPPRSGEGKPGKLVLPQSLVLFGLNLQTRQARLVLALDQRGEGPLLTYGQPPAAVGVAAFDGDRSLCGEGAATIISAPLGAKRPQGVPLTGAYGLAQTSDGTTVVDLAKGKFLMIDPVNFQGRLLIPKGKHAVPVKVPKGERPLAYDLAANLLKTLVVSEQGRVVAVHGPALKSPARLPLPEGERLVLLGTNLGTLSLAGRTGELTLTDLAQPFGSNRKERRHRMRLPVGFPLSALGVNVASKASVLLIYGGGPQVAKLWRRGFVYDYASGAQLATLAAEDGTFVAGGGISSDGRTVVLLLRDERSLKPRVAKVYREGQAVLDFDLALAGP